MLKAIFFDIDDTLYSTSKFATRARLSSVQAMIKAGLEMDVAECLRELEEVVDEFGSNYGHHYNKLLLRIPPERYANANRAIIIAAGVVAYHQTKDRGVIPFDDVVDVLQKLSKTDLTLGVITAGPTIKQAEKLVRMNIHSYFDPKAIFITEEVGIWKPNPKLYSSSCHKIGYECEECMYVGDRPVNDIDPANSVGMMTIHFASSGKYKHKIGKTQPNYRIKALRELLDILTNDFGIKL